MEKALKKYLIDYHSVDAMYNNFYYKEDVNKDANTNEWLENGTSYIYKVGIMAAIDSNKCDWVYVVIATQRTERSEIEIKGNFYFSRGENDDISRVLERANKILRKLHVVFDE